MGGRMYQPERDSRRRETGRTGTPQRNKDKLGPNSGSMGKEDQRMDRNGSVHNQDALGLQSKESEEAREEMARVRRRLARHRRRGSR
jgi:hypothetical protein